jgi:hypothetical protein
MRGFFYGRKFLPCFRSPKTYLETQVVDPKYLIKRRVFNFLLTVISKEIQELVPGSFNTKIK